MRELLVRSEDPVLFDMLRHLAEKVWHANGMHGSSSWCNVDIIRVRDGDGKPFIILGVDPIYARGVNSYVGSTSGRMYVEIRETFPGGHRILIN